MCGKPVASLPIFRSICNQSLFCSSNCFAERFSPVKDFTTLMQGIVSERVEQMPAHLRHILR